MAGALESLLAQELGDFELIVCDNASEDATAEIAATYAARDGRVRVTRNLRNLGLARNFNRTLELASGKYFAWAAHDDWHSPQWLAACAEVLERDPAAVLCGSAVAIVDVDDAVLEEWHPAMDLTTPESHLRLHRLMWYMGETHPLFALMRTDALRRTRQMRAFVGSDRVVLAELALQGPMPMIDEVLHYYRAPRYRPRSHGPVPKGPRPSLVYDPANRGRLPLRTWRLCWEHLLLVARAQLAPSHKLWLSADVLARFGVRDSRRMAAELYHSSRILYARAISRTT
jgi:glycosyltransferase involved in cell wall biosynthesis